MKRGKKSMIITIGIVCFLLVMIIFMQFKVVQESQESNIDSMQEAELRQELANWKTKYEETKEKNEEKSNTLKTYREESTSDEKTKETLETELESLNMALGKTDVEGEGVIITFRKKEESELSEDERIDEISAIDLVYIVNALKDAGAEAISINDERVVTNTDIALINNRIILVNGRRISGPYVVKAIGDKKYLESAITIKGGYVDLLKADEKTIEYNVEDDITINKFAGTIEFDYINIKK